MYLEHIPKIVCLLAITVLFAFSAAFAADEEVHFSADSLVVDREKGDLKAQGDVQMFRGETELRADQVRWDEKSGDVYGEGGVRMVAPEGTATADSLQFNFNSGRGRMVNARIELPDLAYLSGSEIETLGKDSYKIVNGHFTSCSGEVPAWSFGAEEIDVELGKFARARNARFYIHDVPVLYLPYIAFPAKTERSSGFLMPSLGFSSRRGTEIVVPWFQVFDVDHDATFTLNSMSRVGVGTGLEYRYYYNTVRPARFNANYVSGINNESDRYLLEWQHDGRLAGDARLVIDGQYVNKNDYFDLFGGSPQEYTSDKVQSDLYVSKIWNKHNLTGLARYTRALQQETSTIVQTLPEVGLTVVQQRLLQTPLFAAADVEIANFWRYSGETGTRFRLFPRLSSDILSSRYLNVLPTIAWREQFYQVGASIQSAGRPEASVAIGNRFARIYTSADGQNATRHAVEVKLDYLYAPNVDTSNIQSFDFRDEFLARNLFRLTVANRWTIRHRSAEGLSTYRDLVNLRLSADYDLHEQRRTLGPTPDRHAPFSPLLAELEYRPHQRVYLRTDVELAIEQHPGRVDALAVWGGATDQAGNGLLLNYSYERDGFQYASASADIALLSPFYLNFEERFDLQDRQNLDYRTSLEYRSGCWSLAGHWYERPGDRGASITFSLSNITGRNIRPLTKSLNDWL